MIICDTCGDKGLHQKVEVHTHFDYPNARSDVTVDWCPKCVELVKDQKWEELAVRRARSQGMEAMR